MPRINERKPEKEESYFTERSLKITGIVIKDKMIDQKIFGEGERVAQICLTKCNRKASFPGHKGEG